ncbi:hypothetical protein FC093_17630 [Ilyomonas limi]|uniref:Uncharacterized protein n=1 Tax=Ilyomonas limi TaxID=2575867 RepID=A0A4V5UTX7_9BACT|nr:hypothetical protein [Ilyomonas limi]TKK66393.1 hypothetical protein FC093_17630 [Ilyomonas limi]
MMRTLLSVVLFATNAPLFAQHINDSLLAKVARRFEETQHLSLQKIIPPTALQAGQMPEERLPCYPGRQVTVVAIFDKKPVAAYGRMLVMKRITSTTQFDEHLFQRAGYDETFKVNYVLLSVYFPPEATYKNCNTILQVYDKKEPSNKVWLIILTK